MVLCLRTVVVPFCFTLASSRISPGLHPASDKQFMGKDYPDDGRAFDVSKQGFKPPYPSIQESDEFDKDYVKDENRDNGEWSAQMEYDMARAKVRRAKADLAKAMGMSKGEYDAYQAALKKALASGATAAEARRKAHAAAQKYEDAKAAEKGAEGDAANSRSKHITPGTVDESDLVAAKERLSKEEFQFKICEEQLEKAKQALKDALAARAAKENEEASNAAAQQKAHNDEADRDAAEAERLKGEGSKAAAAEQKAAEDEKKLSSEEWAAQKAAAEASSRHLE